MTIEEVIDNKKKNILEWQGELEMTPSNDLTHIANYKEIIKSYGQEVEWLEELNSLRLQNNLSRDEAYMNGYSSGYSKAENDYFKKTEEDRENAFNCGYEVGRVDAINEFVDALKTEPFSEYVMAIVYHWQNKLKGD